MLFITIDDPLMLSDYLTRADDFHNEQHGIALASFD